MNLKKEQYYRITETSGKKWKGTFEEECNFFGQPCLKFYFEHQIIAISLIEKIEEVTWISPDDQAIAKGCFEEYKTYMTINGKEPRNKYIYKEVA